MVRASVQAYSNSPKSDSNMNKHFVHSYFIQVDEYNNCLLGSKHLCQMPFSETPIQKCSPRPQPKTLKSIGTLSVVFRSDAIHILMSQTKCDIYLWTSMQASFSIDIDLQFRIDFVSFYLMRGISQNAISFFNK